MKLYCELPSFLRLCIVAALVRRRLRGKALLQACIGGVGLVLQGIEHLQMHSAFQNCTRVDACCTLRAAPSSLSVSASLRLPMRAFAASRDDFHE
jgi:hypothetical protein